MIDYKILPTVNALLNTTAALCLLAGWRFIRRGERENHKRAMLAATTVSALFLVSYLTYHFQAGTTRFAGPPPWRAIYLGILGTHTVLAAILPFLVVVTLLRGLRGQFDRHRRVARWTLPIWLYVSVTGVVVYLMLYHFFPSAH